MDQEKIGKFICECRKEKKLTQTALAELLGVSNRSISKWETGKCMPDLSLFQPLCEIFEITINELLSGERLTSEIYQQKLEENMILHMNVLITKLKQNIKRLFHILFFIFFVFFILFLSFMILQEFKYKEKYRVEKDQIMIEVCEVKNDIGKSFIQLYAYTLDHDKVQYHVSVNEGKVNFYFYHSYLEQDMDTLSDKVLLSFNHFSKINSLYYDDELIWNDKMGLKRCENEG